jgi:hypothetical protein
VKEGGLLPGAQAGFARPTQTARVRNREPAGAGRFPVLDPHLRACVFDDVLIDDITGSENGLKYWLRRAELTDWTD